MDKKIWVYADWKGLGDDPVFMGTLLAVQNRGKEIFSFTYEPNWLKRKECMVLDPGLGLFQGPQYPEAGKPNFGLFLDSSPDRWGRVLMDRREAALAAKEGRQRLKLLESGYLLGVHDGQRLGGLRFRTDPDGPFLDNQSGQAAPPSTSLRELQEASWQIQDLDSTVMESASWLNLLVAPGSSLGGARPKAGVKYPDGSLWIAKFPGRADNRDMGAWEWVTWKLGKMAGLELPDAELLRVGTGHHTFMVKRFDRVPGKKDLQRIHFASAMTLLGHFDGDNHQAGASYLELCDWITNHSAYPRDDLEEMWRRIIFSMAVSNTDDHLRNHGFLLTPKGWKLSPAYDINPEPHGSQTGLSLNINEVDNRLDLGLAMEVAEYFRVKRARAEVIIQKVRSAVSNWKTVAKEAGIGRGEIEMMEPAFRLQEVRG